MCFVSGFEISVSLVHTCTLPIEFPQICVCGRECVQWYTDSDGEVNSVKELKMRATLGFLWRHFVYMVLFSNMMFQSMLV